MYLKEIEIQGFKSFPEKVSLKFDEGLTAVVGPNGSGKSNVSDAVRWVLGEQRPKSLRGEKMEDVIFSGTDLRKPLGFAQVALTIDNSDKKLPLDYTEVTVGRRVFRSGESGYFINKTPCRLKDVTELFMDTGVGKEGYSIVGQGRIDEILSAKGEDRRRVFEEAAGIAKYKSRRKEAGIKLEKERENLSRVNDIILELERNLPRLEKQAKEASEFLRLRDELREVDLSIFSKEGKRLLEEQEKAKEKLRIVGENCEEAEVKARQAQEELTKLLDLEEEALKSIQSLNNSIIENRGEKERLEGELRLTLSRIEGDRENILKARKTIDRLEEEIKEKEGEKGQKASALFAVEIDRKEKEERLLGLKEELDGVLKSLFAKEEKAAERKTELFELLKENSEIKGSTERLGAILEEIEKRRLKLGEDIADENARKKELETSANALKKRDLELKKNKESYEKRLEVMEEKEGKLLETLKDVSEKSARLLREKDMKESRLRALKDMERDMEGYQKSVKAILSMGESGRLKGIIGSGAMLMSVPEKFERAIETAMGGHIQSIVTENEESAKSALNYLKASALGRATFLPVATVKGKKGMASDVKLKDGVFGTAKSLVAFNPKFDGIFSYILGNTLVVDNMDTAINLEREYRQGLRVVTLDGDIINPGGAITGGARGKSLGVLGRKREIEDLEKEVSKEKERISELGGKEGEIRKNLSLISEKKEELGEILKEILINLAALKERMAQKEKETEDSLEKLKYLNIESAQVNEQEESARERLFKLKEQEKDLKEKIDAMDSSLNLEDENTKEEKEKREKLENEITGLRLGLSALKERKAAAEQSLLEIEKRKEELFRQKEAEEEEIKGLALGIEEKTEKKAKIEEDIVSAEKRLSGLKEELEEKADSRDKIKALYIEKKEEKEESDKEAMLLKNEETRLGLSYEKLKSDSEELGQRMWEEYSVTFREAREKDSLDSGLSELKTKQRGLKSRIKEFGFVNTSAVAELKETKERYEFLLGQKEDIVSAEKKLLGLIDSLTKSMRETFEERFKAISENFSKVFSEMFGGGEAYLKLGDGDVLESEIDIIAKPPGKRLQSMSLLSGGERALTAISILFAILKLKPSPFCILDEIESALDDANVYRFATYLKRYSKTTQFIVITHRKGTMEAADRMYGVTMEEKGVSKLISVNFSDDQEG